jgi:hypothetical protein
MREVGIGSNAWLLINVIAKDAIVLLCKSRALEAGREHALELHPPRFLDPAHTLIYKYLYLIKRSSRVTGPGVCRLERSERDAVLTESGGIAEATHALGTARLTKAAPDSAPG